MIMKLLGNVTSLSIYHGCSTRKKFWEGNFIPGEFTPMNMKHCGCRNVRKHREIKDSYKCIILEMSLKFGSLDRIIITVLEQKYYLGRSGKGLNTSLSLNTNIRSNRYKNGRYVITNVSTKDISKIIKEFEK